MSEIDTLIRELWELRDKSRYSDDRAVRIEFAGDEYAAGIVFDAVLDCCHLCWRDPVGYGQTPGGAVGDAIRLRSES